MTRAAGVVLRLLTCLLAAVVLTGCEKGTRWAAEREFRELLARDLASADEARELEAFIERYPEPKTNPNLLRAYMMLGVYHDREHRYEIAASWYERALRVSPNDPDLMNSLGYLYARHGLNLDRAVVLLETAVRLAEQREYPPRRLGLIKDSLGWAYRARGDLPQAVVELEEACRLAPGVAILREHLAATYRDIGEIDRSVAIYLDLYLAHRGTDRRLRMILENLDREGRDGASLGVARRIAAGLKALDEADRREAEARGARLVDLEAADGYRLRGSLFLPEANGMPQAAGSSGRRGGVLLLHALGSSRAAASGLARRLAAHGQVVLTIDLRGHGASVSEAIPTSHEFSDELPENLRGAEMDSRAALALLERHSRVDGGRLAAVGAGMGALLAARSVAGAAPHGVRALVLLSPWGLTDAYRDPLVDIDPRALMLLAGADETSAVATVRRLAEEFGVHADRALAVAQPGSGFGLAGGGTQAGDRIVSFLIERLRPLASPRPAAAGNGSEVGVGTHLDDMVEDGDPPDAEAQTQRLVIEPPEVSQH
jgi:dienelactone hydrolase